MDVWLAPAGNNGNGSVLVGRGISDELGIADTTIELPADLATEPYEVYVSFSGNKTYQDSVSD